MRYSQLGVGAGFGKVSSVWMVVVIQYRQLSLGASCDIVSLVLIVVGAVSAQYGGLLWYTLSEKLEYLFFSPRTFQCYFMNIPNKYFGKIFSALCVDVFPELFRIFPNFDIS
jgi:hypothetical protein